MSSDSSLGGVGFPASPQSSDHAELDQGYGLPLDSPLVGFWPQTGGAVVAEDDSQSTPPPPTLSTSPGPTRVSRPSVSQNSPYSDIMGSMRSESAKSADSGGSSVPIQHVRTMVGILRATGHLGRLQVHVAETMMRALLDYQAGQRADGALLESTSDQDQEGPDFIDIGSFATLLAQLVGPLTDPQLPSQPSASQGDRDRTAGSPFPPDELSPRSVSSHSPPLVGRRPQFQPL